MGAIGLQKPPMPPLQMPSHGIAHESAGTRIRRPARRASVGRSEIFAAGEDLLHARVLHVHRPATSATTVTVSLMIADLHVAGDVCREVAWSR